MYAKKLAILVFGVPLAVMFFAGRGEVPEERPAIERPAPASPGGFASVVQTEPAVSEEVMLERSSDGHFYADALVEGAPIELLVDTGASAVALTAADADAAGIFWSEEELAPIARGASGPVYGVAVTLNELRIGDFEANGVEAIIVPEGLPISLLGQSFLRQVPDVAIQGDSMIFRN